MLEILLLVYLSKQVRRIVESKGRSKAGWYQFMLVGMWFGGEIIGMVCGIAVTGDFGAAAYLFALGGAIAGTIGAFIIVKNIAPATIQQRGFSVMPPDQF